MSHARIDDWVSQDSSSQSVGMVDSSSNALKSGTFGPTRQPSRTSSSARRTPRVSVILLIPDDQIVEPARLALRLPATPYAEVDVTVVACAGEPSNLDELRRTVGDAQFLFAPAGTSAEDLRELAMEQTPGDIVTLLSGDKVFAPAKRDRVITS